LRRTTIRGNTGVGLTAGGPVKVSDCLICLNGTGISLTVNSALGQFKNIIIDRNTTGISAASGTLRGNNIVNCRITNNTTGITLAASVAIETFMCAYYGNTAKTSLGASAVLDGQDDLDMASDGYTNAVGGDYSLLPNAEYRSTAANIFDTNLKVYITAGIPGADIIYPPVATSSGRIKKQPFKNY
jgi:hypothetical protein